jgi:hypothetical protein
MYVSSGNSEAAFQSYIVEWFSRFPDLLLTVLLLAAWVRAQVRSCGICGGQGGTGAGFLQVLQFPLPILIPSASNTSSSLIQVWYNLPNSGRRAKWTQSHPTARKQKLFFSRGLSFGKFGLYALEIYQQFIKVKELNVSERISQAYVTLQISHPHLK